VRQSTQLEIESEQAVQVEDAPLRVRRYPWLQEKQ